jgi:hypothetical protein
VKGSGEVRRMSAVSGGVDQRKKRENSSAIVFKWSLRWT